MKLYFCVFDSNKDRTRFVVADQADFDKTGQINKRVVKDLVDLRALNRDHLLSPWSVDSDGFLVAAMGRTDALGKFAWNSTWIENSYLVDPSGTPKWKSSW